jgi:hypothetical protein
MQCFSIGFKFWIDNNENVNSIFVVVQKHNQSAHFSTDERIAKLNATPDANYPLAGGFIANQPTKN